MSWRSVKLGRAVAVVMAALVAGCTGAPIHIDPPELPDALVEPLPLRVGVYIPRELRDYSFKDDHVASARIEVGAASTAALLSAFRSTFAETVELDEPAGPGAAGLDASLRVISTYWTTAQDPEVQPTFAMYDIDLLSPEGAVIGRWHSAQKVGLDEARHEVDESLFSLQFTEIFHHPSKILIERVAGAFLRDFREQPGIRDWLEQQGAYRPAMPPPAVFNMQPVAGIGITGDAASEHIRRCLADELADLLPGRPIVPARSVYAATYPWLTDRPPAAIAAARLAALARYPPARARLQEMGVGAVVLVTGGTTQDWHGGGFCGGGFGVAGCLGLLWGKRDSLITAAVLGLSTPELAVQREAHREGTAVMPMFLVPLPLIPATQTGACRELGETVAGLLRQ